MDDLWKKYKKLEVVGAGSFGKVYRIQCKATNEIYVMKRVSLAGQPKVAQDEAFGEVAILKKLKHPHVVNIIEFSWDELEQDLLIVMDYCDSGDLYEFIQNHAQQGVRIPEDVVWFFMVQLLSALAYVHTEKRIMHRDFKSQNVFLTRKGGEMVCQLGDFGLAKQLEHTFQMAKTPLGTPYYMAPEILEGKAYNYKSDIWALGCVLHEMCSLKPTFQGDGRTGADIQRVALRILRREHGPIPEGYSDDLRAVIGMMLSPKPPDRMHARDLLTSPLLEAPRAHYLQRCAAAGLNYRLWEPRLRPKAADGGAPAAPAPPRAKAPAKLEPLGALPAGPLKKSALPPLKSPGPAPLPAAAPPGRPLGQDTRQLGAPPKAVPVQAVEEVAEEEDYEDDFEDYADDWESDTELDDPTQSGVLRDQRMERAAKLREHCVEKMGSAKYKQVYEFLKNKLPSGFVEDDEMMTTIELEEILGVEHMEFWPLIDEIIFYETSD